MSFTYRRQFDALTCLNGGSASGTCCHLAATWSVDGPRGMDTPSSPITLIRAVHQQAGAAIRDQRMVDVPGGLAASAWRCSVAEPARHVESGCPLGHESPQVGLQLAQPC